MLFIGAASLMHKRALFELFQAKEASKSRISDLNSRFPNDRRMKGIKRENIEFSNLGASSFTFRNSGDHKMLERNLRNSLRIGCSSSSMISQGKKPRL